MNLLFEHGCIITVNPQEEVFRDGWLLVEDGKIAGLGDGAYDGPVAADRRINAAGQKRRTDSTKENDHEIRFYFHH